VTVFVPIGKQRKNLPMVISAPVGSVLKVIYGMMVSAALILKVPTSRMRVRTPVAAPKMTTAEPVSTSSLKGMLTELSEPVTWLDR
jgi:hypothetical protein